MFPGAHDTLPPPPPPPTLMNNETTTAAIAGSAGGGEEQRGKCKEMIFYYFVLFTRFWGIFTAIVLCGIGIEVVFYRHNTGYYFICGGMLLLLLETAWVIGVFLRICIRNEQHKIFRCWSVVQWFDCWKRSLVYGPLAVLPIVFPHRIWLSYLAGAQLITLAGLHLVLSFRGSSNTRRCRRLRQRRLQPKERLLHTDSYESSRFDDVLDDVAALPGSSYSLVEDATVLQI